MKHRILLRAIAIGVVIFSLNGVNAFAQGAACGNSMLNPLEECDDGNNLDGDGCSRLCEIEDGWECSDPYLPLGTVNLVGDAGFEDGPGSNFWTDNSSFQPALCDATNCPTGVGARMGTGWAQLGGQPTTEFYDVSQDVSITPGFKFLRFDVSNSFCFNPDLPDSIQVRLDGEVAWTTDAADCEVDAYRPITINMDTVPGAPFDTGSPVTVSLTGVTSIRVNEVAFDNIRISKAGGAAVGSVCTLRDGTQYFQPFEGIGGPLGPPDFFQTSIGDIFLEWGTTDDGFCGTAENPPGNHTGEPGEAACIDSTAAVRAFVEPFESYVCTAPVDLTSKTGSMLQFVVNYQPGPVTSSDFFGIWVDINPFFGPLAAGAGSADFLVNSPLGVFGVSPGVMGNLDISDMDGQPQVYVCFGYGNEGEGYAQVDTVILSTVGCIDDFEEDKLESCNDNCSTVFNPMQTDSDNDGYGNACDADIAENLMSTRAATANGNDCVVNFLDVVTFADAFSSTPFDSNWNPDADFDDNRVINFLDLAELANMFLGPPGPSGLTTTCGGGTSTKPAK